MAAQEEPKMMTPTEAAARRALVAYGPNKPFTNFSALTKRAGFPAIVMDYLKYSIGVSGMGLFLTMDMRHFLHVMPHNYKPYAYTPDRHYVDGQTKRSALEIWYMAREAVLGVKPPYTKAGNINLDYGNKEEDMTNESYIDPTSYHGEEVNVNAERNEMIAERNEMIALIQGYKGAQFVNVHMQLSRLDETGQKRVGRRFTYKAIGLDLKEGDYVVVQYLERLGIGVVDHVFAETPTSDEYDYSKNMRHVVQKIDVTRSKQLVALDRQLLRSLTQSEAQSRMERMTRQLGVALDAITLELPLLEGETE